MTLQIDTLYLLPSGFNDDGHSQYCPECAEIWGVLCYYPQVKDSLCLQYCDLAKPREALFSRLGPNHQNCPTLILSEKSLILPNTGLQSFGNYHFYDNAKDIGRYWALSKGIAFPRGHG